MRQKRKVEDIFGFPFIRVKQLCTFAAKIINMKKYIYLLILIFAAFTTNAQTTAKITGNLQTNGNFFIADSAIGASNTPQYDYQKYGAESWMNLNYSNWGFDMGLRFDVFQNSNLRNPLGSYSDQGIGRWFVKKQVHKLDISAGHLYDQIGTGIIFRAYEERSLFIDQALFGVRLGYKLNENWSVKAFTGRQKRQFNSYGSVLHGAAVEGFIKPDSTKNLSFAPGFGVVTRTFDKATVDEILNTLSGYAPRDQEGAQYNTTALTLYNTMSAGKITWYAEGALKTKDVLNDPFARVTSTGGFGRYRNATGYVGYTSLSYAANGLGITLEGKRTQNFQFRSLPNPDPLQGAVNFLPVMAKQNTYRLTTRFSPATQELSEQALQMDVRYAINKKLNAGINISNIANLDGTLLYREFYPELTYKYKRKWTLNAGVQVLQYNQQIYQGKGGMVKAITPAAEFLYKFTPRRSLRIETQYLNTKQEFGSWAFLLAEVGLAPHWLVFASDMYKVPHKNKESYPADKTKFDGFHYPTVGVVYTHKSNRFALSYVKQVEGINCSGGICRYEPTFHGVKLGVNSSF
jgi:hypothetical protein